uniref:Uncharacterized protein At4g30180 n=1 Tax=Anthurium amnicola TaxID=1678845 RepID=A0A1D1YAA8_9ARAE
MEAQRSKWRRVYSFEPRMVMLANFSLRYFSYLMPVLHIIGKVRSSRRNTDKELEKIVNFEVNMALVASASGFAWSRALKRKLEKGMNAKKFRNVTSRQLVTSNLPFTCTHKNAFPVIDIFNELWAFPLISRPLAPISFQMSAKTRRRTHKATKSKIVFSASSSRRKLSTEDEELCDRLRTLRKILPGGNDMGVVELLSEVGSYAVCLKLQVDILRSLLSDEGQ